MKKYVIMKEVKPKSIIVDGDLHNKFKVLCKGKSLKIGGVVEDLMNLYLDNPRAIQRMIDELKEKDIKVI